MQLNELNFLSLKKQIKLIFDIMEPLKVKRYAVYENDKFVGHIGAPDETLACIAYHMQHRAGRLHDMTNPHIMNRYKAIEDKQEILYKFPIGFEIKQDPDLILYN